MPNGKLIARHEDKIVASSSSSDNDNHESFGTDEKESPEV
jgi:hypothetical protein